MREHDLKKSIMADRKISDMEKLDKIFHLDAEKLKERFPQLYYAILAVLDKEKKPDPSGYFSS